jgi:probable F420-dependent oxidoreductase
MLRIGAKVQNSGPLPEERGIAAMASELEEAGFASLWVSDHVVLTREVRSHYPFAPDGRATWPMDTPYFDAMVALSVIATATRHAVIGTAVLVLPQREPVVLAKQAASIDVLSGGRLALGVGAGWMAEEFEALDVPFQSRGERFVEWLSLLRSCWSGDPEPFHGKQYELPAGVVFRPVPAHRIPLLVGGHSAVALRRAGALGDGWLAHQSARQIDTDELRRGVAAMRAAAEQVGRDPDNTWTTLRLIESAPRPQEVAAAMPAIIAAGVDEVVVDVDWSVENAAARTAEMLHEAVR